MPVVYPDELPLSSNTLPGAPAGVNSAVQAMMRANGIAPDAKPLASRKTSQMRMAHIEMERYGPGADGAMHRKRLNATSVGVHNDIKNLFQTAEHKLALVDIHHDHKAGSLQYRDERLPPSSSTTTPSVFRTPGSALIPAASAAAGDDDECAFPHAEGMAAPRTAEDLVHLIAELKPAKKILKVAVDVEIKETFVTELVVKREAKPQRQPVLVVVCHNALPSQQHIQGSPRLMGMWRIGQRTPTTQVLVLRCTKTVDIHVHFTLEVAVPQ
ncbi:hypothetical protein JCM10450v2_000679 [Rhodotorula kratochvilovae]